MKIVLNGRGGKVGSVLAPALERAGHELVGELDGADATIDFTTPEAVVANVLRSVAAGVPVVVGTSGWDVADVDGAARAAGVAVFYAPNFAIGAVLMMRFAAEAARDPRGGGDRRAPSRDEARCAVGHREGDGRCDGRQTSRSIRCGFPVSSRTRRSCSAVPASC